MERVHQVREGIIDSGKDVSTGSFGSTLEGIVCGEHAFCNHCGHLRAGDELVRVLGDQMKLVRHALEGTSVLGELGGFVLIIDGV